MSRGILVIGDGSEEVVRLLRQLEARQVGQSVDLIICDGLGVPPAMLEDIEQQRLYENELGVMLGMNFTGIEDRIVQMVRYSAKSMMMARMVESLIPEWPVEAYDMRPPSAPPPLPPKGRLKINQAPRQSFRQSMRSVNRNR